MGILAVYDTVGIQSYIFASNKLAENVGGSKLVADIFGTYLPEIVKKVAGQELPDWRKSGRLNPALKAEIIYQGGGNAFVAFADDDTLQAVTKEFLTRVAEMAPGVGVAVAAIETEFGDTYGADFDRLNKRLTLVKGGFNTAVFAGNQPITKQSGRTGLPVSIIENNEYLTESQSKKRKRYAVYKRETAKIRGFKSSVENFEDLGLSKGEDSLIAIIHADGNNMGKRIKKFMENFATYAEAVPKIRKLSRAINECYQNARDNTIAAFNTEYSYWWAQRKEKYPNKMEPPIMELIGDGDDTTLVISGRFAIDFAARLLREIETQPDPFGEGAAPTACAGVVLFHSHYPFSEAYKLTEELCGSAKKLSRESEGSYIDFHLHQSGNVATLHDLRERQYKVDGKSILRRPWRASNGQEGKLPSFKWFEENIGRVSKLPRNKTKAMRNAIGAGEHAAEIAENGMRGDKLPEFPISPEDCMSKYAALFDILEVYDTYENLLNFSSPANPDSPGEREDGANAW
ncbi:MAG: hypothetical protein LBL96_03700 [Clostridiales bacterium]|nr:hypothetical protein [Clostridiales bacterium]